MIQITNWVADIPAEEKHIAYMGENETVKREFLLSGEDAKTYANWIFRLDMRFDTSTVTTSTTRETQSTETQSSETITETAVSGSTRTLRESGTVTEVAVDCDNTTDVAYLDKEFCPEGIRLVWTVLAQQTRLPGRLWATIRAQNGNGAVKKSAVMTFTVDKAVMAEPASIPTQSEFEAMENAMDLQMGLMRDVALGVESMARAAETACEQTVEVANNARRAADEAAASRVDVAAAADLAFGHMRGAQTAAVDAMSAAEEAAQAAAQVHMSAYDIAVENGFEGSEQAWLESLKGADGATTEQVIAALATEEWVFTLADGTAVTKVVPLV